MRVPVFFLCVFASACGGRVQAAREAPNPAQPAPTAAAPAENDPFATEISPPGPPRPPRAHTSAIETLGITPPSSPWSTMTKQDKELYMIGKVLPIMQETFAARDEQRFADLQCETCHGDDARDREFKMPPPTSFPVPPPDSRAFERLERRQPDMVRFMRTTVMPTMGRLVGNDSYTCAHCHPTAAP